jgi:hypothetical protein
MLSIIGEGGTLTTNRFSSLLDSYLENVYCFLVCSFIPLCFLFAELVTGPIHWILLPGWSAKGTTWVLSCLFVYLSIHNLKFAERLSILSRTKTGFSKESLITISP